MTSVNHAALSKLIEAKALIEDPAHWMKGTIASVDGTAKGAVRPYNPSATCFCSLGALHRVCGDPRGVLQPGSIHDHAARTLCENILRAAVDSATGHDFIVDFNDDPSTTHADVMRVFDLAIERLKGTV